MGEQKVATLESVGLVRKVSEKGAVSHSLPNRKACKDAGLDRIGLGLEFKGRMAQLLTSLNSDGSWICSRTGTNAKGTSLTITLRKVQVELPKSLLEALGLPSDTTVASLREKLAAVK